MRYTCTSLFQRSDVPCIFAMLAVVDIDFNMWSLDELDVERVNEKSLFTQTRRNYLSICKFTFIAVQITCTPSVDNVSWYPNDAYHIFK